MDTEDGGPVKDGRACPEETLKWTDLATSRCAVCLVCNTTVCFLDGVVEYFH